MSPLSSFQSVEVLKECEIGKSGFSVISNTLEAITLKSEDIQVFVVESNYI